MVNKKNFIVKDTLVKIGYLFIKSGYNGTSLEDIVQTTGILRGSLYGTFGSKEGMFIDALKVSLDSSDPELKWGLIMVAMLEVTPRSKKTYNLIQSWYLKQHNENIAELIGQELLKHSGILK
ncbi:TetR/AcrR family transcriptional regulator [Pediococcus argentinicus]|uniref:HMG-I and HMG-Y, DNA-binding regulatory protein, TetR n=1 Tax=Pediococcus argentinicus TaxID=480391 RepID=A0A0R2NI81_9LACO|nr:helix-turn-helix domain-containing protein [Pediococcus argentinicus]KRO25503.1 HMG-I and HMG-Y, DNA-binding regulatory protein, TetR [Pediococcus argentinicus]NKZ22197.1 helix-turn-helix transcriptional regulator [Pediococcus argentinicus]GEP19246.1 hypothetical protein LSA03_06300 [Pediococcus argentinicus]